ncbi:ATP-dependent Clp protease adaptor protein ClpS [Treponema primitia ZAS-2]|uniref:ATP-dependent Clp protease adapter protein ClpS n=1 Tax=Treponema primitia (strain ATCC BAA-887 / DSM 12427 / ZAS-2) TaxID=545694 RepID=F5YPX8_TREPZ|nr:ATP-dependent Clp protease adaptor ClpS [Treponema primitia]AEF84007.1 ATP-dependent Clp protease adaptor protein ClpS [Treponema primitia ZAS-2]
MPSLFGNETDLAAKKKEKLSEPEDFRVVILNDHFTTMEFVVEILMGIFHKSVEEANRLMLEIHRKGRSIAGVYSWDIAQTKAEQVHTLARQNEFPLRCVVEKA